MDHAPYRHRQWLMVWFTPSGERPSQRLLAWMKANDSLQRNVIRQIREPGPLPSRAFEDQSTGA